MAAAGVPSVDAEICREHLGTLLTEEIAALRDLEDLLTREYEVLGAKNVAAIERTALVRQQMVGDLARTEEQRRSLCTMHGYSADWVGLESLMRWCDPKARCYRACVNAHGEPRSAVISTTRTAYWWRHA